MGLIGTLIGLLVTSFIVDMIFRMVLDRASLSGRRAPRSHDADLGRPRAFRVVPGRL